MRFSKLALAASAIVLSTAAFGPANAETCAEALTKAQANINVSALSSDDREDYNEIVNAATKAQAEGDSSLCFEKVANLNDEFDMEEAEERAEARAEQIRDRAERADERAEQRAEAELDRGDDAWDTRTAASGNLNTEADTNANNMAQINASANSALNADSDALLVRDIDGMTLYNTADAEVGKVRSIVENPSDGEDYLVVRQGGFFGLGGKDYLVPADQVMLEGKDLTVSSLNSTDLDSYTVLERNDRDAYVTLDSDARADALISINR